MSASILLFFFRWPCVRFPLLCKRSPQLQSVTNLLTKRRDPNNGHLAINDKEARLCVVSAVGSMAAFCFTPCVFLLSDDVGSKSTRLSVCYRAARDPLINSRHFAQSAALGKIRG